jgi:hypothetical protein
VSRALLGFTGLGLVLALSGCGLTPWLRTLAPGQFGLEAVSTSDGLRLYVEPAMTPAQRAALQQQIALGREQVQRFWGPLQTTPAIVACSSADCAARFDVVGPRAAAFADQAIRLSPRGLSAPLVAHEWSHAELYRRAGGWWQARGIPRWFDEGLAVVVADEPVHSEANWQRIRDEGLATPRLAELLSFADWGRAMGVYGETAGDVPENRRRVYTTAGHELRRWLACAGPGAAPALLTAVRDGEAFGSAYRRLQMRDGAPCPLPASGVVAE